MWPTNPGDENGMRLLIFSISIPSMVMLNVTCYVCIFCSKRSCMLDNPCFRRCVCARVHACALMNVIVLEARNIYQGGGLHTHTHTHTHTHR